MLPDGCRVARSFIYFIAHIHLWRCWVNFGCCGHQTHTNTQLYVSAFSLERSLKLVQDLPKGHFCVQTEGVGDLGPVQSPEP